MIADVLRSGLPFKKTIDNECKLMPKIRIKVKAPNKVFSKEAMKIQLPQVESGIEVLFQPKRDESMSAYVDYHEGNIQVNCTIPTIIDFYVYLKSGK